MIVVALFGGLGSQMDQYSFYLALKKHYPNTDIKLSLCNILKPDHNGFELERVFGIKPREASVDEILQLSDIYPYCAKFQRVGKLIFDLRRIIFGPKSTWITPYDPSAYYGEVFELSSFKSYLFWGNWLNEKYRTGIDEEIYASFSFPDFVDSENMDISDRITSSNSVSIHVRRGDYVQFGLPLLSLNYYKRAVKMIESSIDSPSYFVFSNDINYVKDNFGFLKNYEIISNNSGANSFRDMQLMSMCKHNIIANSTFSYWGARLNRNPGSLVICPKYHADICKYTWCLPSWYVIDNHL